MYLIFKARKVGITFSPFSDESLRSSPLPPSPRLPWLHGKKWGSRNSDPGPLIPNPVFFLPQLLTPVRYALSLTRTLVPHGGCSVDMRTSALPLPRSVYPKSSFGVRGEVVLATLKGKRGDSFQMSLLSSIQHSFWYLEFPLSPFHPFAFM